MFQSKMYQKVNLRIFFYLIVLSFLSCSFIPSKTKVIPISGGVEITLPFYVKGGFRFIQLSLSPDQKPLRFLVDTGSRFSFLDERYFTELDSKKESLFLIREVRMIPIGKSKLSNCFTTYFQFLKI